MTHLNNSILMKKYDVFICNSRRDKDVAEKILARLIERNITVFNDADGIYADENFASVLTESISNSRCLLYLHSEYSIQSNWVKKELEFAINKGLEVIAVNISGFRLDDSFIRNLLGEGYWLEYDEAAYDSQMQFDKLIYNIWESVIQTKRQTPPEDFEENSYREISSKPKFIQFDSLPKEFDKKAKEEKLSQYEKSVVRIILSITLIFVSIFGICIGFDIGVIFLIITSVLFFVIGFYLLYLSAANVRYWVMIHNTDIRRRIVIRVDGEVYNKLDPLDVCKIERRGGEHIISAQVEDESSYAVIVHHIFNSKTQGKIIPISVAQEQVEIRKSDTLKYRCFIAGSTSITNERNAARAALSILYNQYEKYDFYITAHTYEDFKNKHKIDGHQYDYDTFIREKADCVIFIICNHVGDKTLKEYGVAIETFESTNSKRPAIFVYNDVSCVNTISEQDLSVINFRKMVDSKHAYWRDYVGEDMLMLKIKEDISAELTDVLEMKPSIRNGK